jgi:hypothetical protein
MTHMRFTHAVMIKTCVSYNNGVTDFFGKYLILFILFGFQKKKKEKGQFGEFPSFPQFPNPSNIYWRLIGIFLLQITVVHIT